MALSALRELHLNDFRPPGAAFHLARARYRPGGSIGPHGHDFAELFWIESGRGLHRTAAGAAEIAPGFVCLVAAGDVHAISAGWGDALTLANVAFPDASRAALAGLCGDSDLPAAIAFPGAVVTPECARRLSAFFAELSHGPPSALALHGFLLRALAAIESDRATAATPSSPAWLTRAIATLRADESLLAEGLPALCRIAGRSPDHVTRVARRSLGESATGLVNRLRLEHAERLLQTTSLEVTEIAYRSGFGNLSYFYRLFRRRAGLTPRAWRTRARQPVAGNGGEA